MVGYTTSTITRKEAEATVLLDSSTKVKTAIINHENLIREIHVMSDSKLEELMEKQHLKLSIEN